MHKFKFERLRLPDLGQTQFVLTLQVSVWHCSMSFDLLLLVYSIIYITIYYTNRHIDTFNFVLIVTNYLVLVPLNS